MFVGPWLGAWGVLSVVALGAPKPAAVLPASARSFYVEYDAGAGCPEVGSFVDALMARAKRAEPVVSPEQAAIRFRIEARAEASTLWVMLEEGSSRREFSGTSCAAIVETMAFVAAMVVEAEPGSRLSEADRVARSQEVNATSPTSASFPPPTTPASNSPAVPPPATERRTSPSGGAKPAAAPPMRWALAASAGLLTETAVVGTPPPGGFAGVELGWRRERGWGLASRVEALVTVPATEQANAGDAELAWAAGRASGCALRGFGAWALGPCLTLDLGWLTAKGTGYKVSNGTEQTMPWLAAGATLRLEYRLSQAAALEAALGGRLLRRHDQFYLRPGTTIYQVPPASFGAQLGVNFKLF